MECFKKVLRLAEIVNNAQLNNENLKLYVSILNKFVYFIEKEGFTAVIYLPFSLIIIKT